MDLGYLPSKTRSRKMVGKTPSWEAKRDQRPGFRAGAIVFGILAFKIQSVSPSGSQTRVWNFNGVVCATQKQPAFCAQNHEPARSRLIE